MDWNIVSTNIVTDAFNIMNNSIDEIVNWDAEFVKTKDTSPCPLSRPR
jgi:hypothetical protein